MIQGQNVNNYEKWCQEWQERFLTLDLNILLKKLPELKTEGDYLTLLYFHKKYGIHTKTGEIICFESQKPLTLFSKLNIYTLLWYSKENAALQGEWLPFRSLKDASPFGPAFQKTVTEVFAATFAGHVEELTKACLAMGGQKLSHSDAGFELSAFACIPVRYLFWDTDEEFPAQANILFDRSATDYIHVESLVSIASEGLSLLSDLADLPIKGNTFS